VRQSVALYEDIPTLKERITVFSRRYHECGHFWVAANNLGVSQRYERSFLCQIFAASHCFAGSTIGGGARGCAVSATASQIAARQGGATIAADSRRRFGSRSAEI